MSHVDLKTIPGVLPITLKILADLHGAGMRPASRHCGIFTGYDCGMKYGCYDIEHTMLNYAVECSCEDQMAVLPALPDVLLLESRIMECLVAEDVLHRFDIRFRILLYSLHRRIMRMILAG